MRIHLVVQEHESEKIFTPWEPVKGWVRLKLDHSTAISDVTLSLEGSVRTSLIDKGPAFTLGSDVTVVGENHKLFRLPKVLFPHADMHLSSGGYTLSEGEYALPFEISFPLEPRCPKSQPKSRHMKTVLPPSFEAHAAGHGAEAKIEYILAVDVKRPGRLQKRISIQRKLMLLPLDPDPNLIPSSDSGYYARQGALYISHLARSLEISALHSPRALPILILEGRLPSPPILYPEKSLPLQLFVRSLSTQMEHLLPIRLRSLAITLQSTMAVTAGTHHTSWTSSRNLLNLKGLKEVVSCVQETEMLSEIDNSILQNVTIPNVTPSFTTCTVEQKYSLKVDAGFSLGETAKLRQIEFVINVEIWAGTGTVKGLYTTMPGDLRRSEDRNPLVPLRPGCLAHLGAVEAAAGDRGPPPYC